MGSNNHSDKNRQQHDFYATDPVAVDKLFTVFQGSGGGCVGNARLEWVM